jgi:N-acetylmuramoyl-L-alanine amidase
MPAILIECGRIDNTEEMARINNDVALEQLCRKIPDGVVDYENDVSKTK